MVLWLHENYIGFFSSYIRDGPREKAGIGVDPGALPALRNQTDGDSAAQNKCPLWAKSGLGHDPSQNRKTAARRSPEIRSLPNEEWEQPFFFTRPSPAQAELVSSEPEVEKEFRRRV
jgi:hypothetical protein